MDPFVFAAVLFAAACHAGWNATIKRGLDPLATTVLISIGAAIVSAAFLPVVGLPAAAAWPWCGASVLIHLVYFAALIESYRAGDMGQVYPIARGSAPLMTAIATTSFIGERLGPLGWSGILLLVAGVILLSLRGRRDGSPLGPRPCRRHAAARLLWHRDLGDDGRSDRYRGGITRNQCPVRRGDRHRFSQGAASCGPCRGGI